jgi:Tfp pilus assembly protein PilN
MRLNINLASLKYEDVRQFFIRWGAALAVLAALAVVLSGLSYFKYSRSTTSARQTSDLQQKITALEKQREQAVAFENRPENRDVTLQKKFWNSQIARRSFSWTQLFNDLQKIMPRRAFLDSVQPELTPENRLKLKLIITGEKKEDARELVEKMENSTRFHSTKPVSETVEKENKPGAVPRYKFEIETYYAPAGSAPLPPPAQNQRGQGNPTPPHPGTGEGM